MSELNIYHNSNWVKVSDVEHRIATDPHTQYALLAGRSGGQTLYGSDTTAEDLTLVDNSVDNNSITVTQAIAAYTHVSNDGSDHSFIDQSVISGATPTFTGTNFTGIPVSGTNLVDGSGLTLTTDTLDLDIDSLAADTIVAGDFVPFWDITATATNKKTTFANFEAALDHTNILNVGTNTHAQIDTAITASTNHIADNTQAHSDYLINNGPDIMSVGNVEGLTIQSTNSGYLRLTTTAGGTDSRNWGIATEYNAEGYFEVLRSTTEGGVADTMAFRIDKDGTVTIPGDVTGANLNIANWDTAYTHSQIAGGNSVHVSTTENTNWDSAYSHISATGASHTYINQSVTDVASPTFDDLTLTGSVSLLDAEKIILGTGSDGEVYSSSDDLYIKNVTQDQDIYFQVNDGGVTKTPLSLQGATGNAVFGHTDSVTLAYADSAFQVLGTGYANSSLALARWAAEQGGTNIIYAKSRGATIGSSGACQNADSIGTFFYVADDGSSMNNWVAEIKVQIDGSVSTGSTPGKIVLKTTPAGSGASVTRMTIGNDGAITMPDVYSDTVGGTNRDLFIDNTGKLGYVSSSERYKKNIVDAIDTSWIYDLRPVEFDYKVDGLHAYGLIAEEVEVVNASLVSYNNDNQPETVSYNSLVTPMLKEIQELRKDVNILKKS